MNEEEEEVRVSEVTVAAVQATPVFLDRDATIEVVASRAREATKHKAKLLVFPETFIPTYPDWVWRSPAWDGPFDQLMERLVEQAVVVPSPATDALGKIAKSSKAYLSVGVNELGENGTLYNAQLMFGPDGSLLGKHRKLMPTGGERLVWGMGDGSDLEVYETPFGTVGGLICWENFMPLARTAMYAKGVEIWTAPTWDNGENWVATLRHIAREGRVFVIGVTTLLRGSDVPDDTPGRELWGDAEDWCNDGWSAIVDPDGQLMAGPLVGEEGILYAQVDTSRLRSERYKFDPVGHYARPDVFHLTVNEDPKPTVSG
jgi:nitrilase